ncbi:hypothetical protein FHG87_013779 [Trinorchestia longiramus]|nr:hypothetical protein FHG87_013779 [Trinorchestia longiramus]
MVVYTEGRGLLCLAVSWSFFIRWLDESLKAATLPEIVAGKAVRRENASTKNNKWVPETFAKAVQISNGGLSKGGLSNGGLSKGGFSNGGLSKGGLSNGGLSEGGLSNGGLSKGGLSNGGLSEGGLSEGGLSNGGLSNGGRQK